MSLNHQGRSYQKVGKNRFSKPSTPLQNGRKIETSQKNHHLGDSGKKLIQGINLVSKNIGRDDCLAGLS